SKTALGMIDDPRIAGVSVTGSTSAGKQIAARAGMNVKKSVLELGGSDPFIVLSDVASVQDCVHSAVRARTQNTGQSCIAAKRFIVQKKIAPEFERVMARAMDELVMGDPLNPDTQIGPLARGDLRQNLTLQMAQSIRMGAKLRTRRKKWKGKGYFFTPSLLSRIKPSMPVFSEETFGPLTGVLSVNTIREAVDAANNTPYGLGASLWTSDLKRAEETARHVESGNVFVNNIVASDPRISFGGTKQSGLGKELGEMGIKEFVNAKTIWVN
ncbi:MAG: aldehyde dehydrogenase family protein, partial [archaeon]